MTNLTSPLSSPQEIARFIQQVKKDGAAHGRLIFGLDATFSRQPTWDQASQVQAEMFQATPGPGPVIDSTRLLPRV